MSRRRRRGLLGGIPIVSDGLIGKWKLDDGSGQTVADSSGNGNDGYLGTTPGELAGEPSWTARGLSFPGASAAESRVTFPADLITGGDPRTICMVVKPGSGNRFGIEFNGDPVGTSFERWALRSSSTPGFVRMEVQGAGQDTALATSADTWHFVAATQSGANFNTAIAYLDGSSQAITASATCVTDGELILGQAGAGTEVEMEAAYVLLYNRALSAEEIAQNRTALTAIMAARGVTLP